MSAILDLCAMFIHTEQNPPPETRHSITELAALAAQAEYDAMLAELAELRVGRVLVQGAADRDEASAAGAALARQLTAACDELSAARAEIEELKEAAREAYLAVERGR